MKKILSILIGLVLLIIIIVLIVMFVSKGHVKTNPLVPEEAVSTLEQFSQKTATEYGIGRFTGYNQVSQNGRFIVFGTFDESAVGNKNGVLVLDTVSGETHAYPGAATGVGTELLFLENAGPVSIVNMRTNKTVLSSYRFGANEYAYDAVISPDDRYVAVNTSEKLVVLDGASGEQVMTLTDGNPRAFEWSSDSSKFLVLKRTGPIQMVDGIETSLRTLLWYSLEKKDYEPIDLPSDLPNPRYVTWVIPDRVLRWNSGYDDGSFDSIVNISTKETAIIGETSANLMNGIWEQDGKLLVVGQKPAEQQNPATLYGFYVYDQKGTLVESYPLAGPSSDTEFIQYMNPRVTNGKYVFIKTIQRGDSRSSEAHVLDPKTKQEKVIYTTNELLNGFTPLSQGILVTENGNIKIISLE